MERLRIYDGSLKGRYHRARYEFALEYCTDKKVIDIACGSGEGTRLIAAVAAEVRGIDPYVGESDVDNNQLEFGFVETLPEASCDVLVCFETIEHTISIDLTVQMLAYALTEEGVLILSFPNGWGESEFHLHDTNIELLSVIEERFEITGVFGQCRKSHIKPVKIDRECASRFENIVITSRKRKIPSGKVPYEERLVLIYKECLKRQKEKVKTARFKWRVFPLRVMTKIKRVFGVKW